MIDLGWSEILIIAIVLIVVVGPKDLPAMLRTFAKSAKKMRGMAGDFRKQFDEALSEAELDDVKKTIADVRNLNPTKAIKDALNPLVEAGESVKRDVEKTGRSIASSATGASAAGIAAKDKAEVNVPAAGDVKLPESTVEAPKGTPDFVKIAEESRAALAERRAKEAEIEAVKTSASAPAKANPRNSPAKPAAKSPAKSPAKKPAAKPTATKAKPKAAANAPRAKTGKPT